MTKPKILSEEPMAMVDIKQQLAAIKKKDKELNFRANKTEEYLGQFVDREFPDEPSHPGDPGVLLYFKQGTICFIISLQLFQPFIGIQVHGPEFIHIKSLFIFGVSFLLVKDRSR